MGAREASQESCAAQGLPRVASLETAVRQMAAGTR